MIERAGGRHHGQHAARRARASIVAGCCSRAPTRHARKRRRHRRRIPRRCRSRRRRVNVNANDIGNANRRCRIDRTAKRPVVLFNRWQEDWSVLANACRAHPSTA